MRKVFVLAGVSLLIVGLLVSMIFATVADTFGPEKTTLTFDQPFDYHGAPVEKGTEIVVTFKTEKLGSEVAALLLPETNFNTLATTIKDTPITAYLLTIAAEKAENKLAYVQGSEGKLDWTATEAGTYFVVLMTPTKLVSKTFNPSITADNGFEYYKLVLKAGSVVSAHFQCTETDDKVRSIIITETDFGKFQAGDTIPASSLLADSVGNSGSVLWLAPKDGTYYLLIKPTAGTWPVPITVNLDTSFVQAGSEWPLSMTYTIEGYHPGPWYYGLPLLAVGVAVIVLGVRKGAVKAPPALTYPPTAPPITAPQPATPTAGFCVYCGAEIKTGAKFCKNCGKPQG